MSRIHTGPVPRTLAAIRAAGIDPDNIMRDGLTPTTYESRALNGAGGWVRDPDNSDELLTLTTLWPTPEIGAEIHAIYVDEITGPANPISEGDLFWSKVNAEPADVRLSGSNPGVLRIVATAFSGFALVAVCVVIARVFGGGA